MEVVEMQANILVYDVGSTYTKAAAFALKDRRFTFLGRGQSPTTLHDVMEGARRAEAAIQAQGVQFAAEMKRYSSCSAAGGCVWSLSDICRASPPRPPRRWL